MEIVGNRAVRFRVPGAEGVTWLITIAVAAVGSLLPRPGWALLVEVGTGLLALAPVVALAALLAGALAVGRWSDRILDVVRGRPARAIVVASIVGAPLYLDGYAALPLVRGLMDLGMGFGPALALMVSGAAVSVYAAVAVAAIVRAHVFVLYVALAMLGACVAGYVAQWLG